MSEVCRKCDGCGRVANTEDEEPWTAWEQLPEQSKAAIRMGLVKPMTCPSCDGVGCPAPLALNADNGATDPLSNGETTLDNEDCDTSALDASSEYEAEMTEGDDDEEDDDVSEEQIAIPYQPTPDEAHQVVVTTRLDSMDGQMETHVGWQPGTSMPELLIAAAALTGNLGRIMAEVGTSLQAAGEDGDWARTNAAILYSMSKGLANMGNIEPASVDASN